MIYAYLRVSTHQQTVDNQMEEINSFAEKRNWKINHYVKESVSGTELSRNRKLGKLLRKLKSGDTLIVSEISRLSRRMTETMAILGKLLEKHVSLYSIKENYAFEDNVNSKVLCFAFGLAAEIERNLISMRTKEALAVRKKNGVRLGRPLGSGKIARLTTADANVLYSLIDNGEDKRTICKRFKISSSTYYKIRKEREQRLNV